MVDRCKKDVGQVLAVLACKTGCGYHCIVLSHWDIIIQTHWYNTWLRLIILARDGQATWTDEGWNHIMPTLWPENSYHTWHDTHTATTCTFHRPQCRQTDIWLVCRCGDNEPQLANVERGKNLTDQHLLEIPLTRIVCWYCEPSCQNLNLFFPCINMIKRLNTPQYYTLGRTKRRHGRVHLCHKAWKSPLVSFERSPGNTWRKCMLTR